MSSGRLWELRFKKSATQKCLTLRGYPIILQNKIDKTEKELKCGATAATTMVTFSAAQKRAKELTSGRTVPSILAPGQVTK